MQGGQASSQVTRRLPPPTSGYGPESPERGRPGHFSPPPPDLPKHLSRGPSREHLPEQMKNKIEVSSQILLWRDPSGSAALGRIITFRIDIKTIIIMKVGGGLCNKLHRVASFIMYMSFTSSLIIILTFRSLHTISAIFIEVASQEESPPAYCQQCWQPLSLNSKCEGLQRIRTEEMFHLFSTFGPRSQTDKTFGRAFV